MEILGAPEHLQRPAAGEPHLWWAHNDPANMVAQPDACWPQEEHERAERFRNPADAARYLHGRWFLRSVLSRYLSRSALEIHFVRSHFGRLQIDPAESDLPPLFFSLSRSGRTALVGVATTPIGVDIEVLQSIPDLEELVEGTLTSEEAASLPPVGDPDRAEAFLGLWTRKEAYLKGVGIGLHADPQAVCVVDGERPELRTQVAGLSPEAATGWWIEDFVHSSPRIRESEEICRGAVATQGVIRRVQAFRTPLLIPEPDGRPEGGPYPRNAQA